MRLGVDRGDRGSADCRAWLTTQETLRHEVFFSPSTTARTDPKPPPEPGPFTVRFTDTGEDPYGVWDPARGSLLDFGELKRLSRV